jgi:hypothetical protein
MTRDADRERTWTERAGQRCPSCGRAYNDTERADVHHNDGDPQNGHPNNRRKRCMRCHLAGEHDRDLDTPRTPSGPRRRSPRGPSRSSPRR